MSNRLTRIVLPLALASVATGATACARHSSPPPAAGTQPSPSFTTLTPRSAPPAASVPDRPGVVYAKRMRSLATVEAVDQGTRTVTLRREDGTRVALKAPPEAQNFDQVRVGDPVSAEYLDVVSVFMRKSEAPPAATEIATLGVAPTGGKPGVVMVDTKETTARVESLDLSTRMLVLQTPDGFRRLVSVNPGVQRLNEMKPGDEVVMRQTEGVVLTLEK
jgi:hypothetical protein